jgi:1-acyl-sn-glycerol-3-phosphate acyltransferase
MASVNTGKGGFIRWVRESGGDKEWGSHPSHFDAAVVESTLRRMRFLYGHDNAYFKLRFEGWERVPDAPCLVVSNHSGGTTFPDAWGFAMGWYTQFGMNRPIHGLAHELVFALNQPGASFAKMGMLRAGRTLALEVLRDWKRDLWVFPGGDLDTWRPHRDRFKVRFSGRKGYARIAIKAGVPIVPVACSGAHQTLMVLTDGQRIARRLHFKELFRANIFPIHLSLPFGLGIGPFPHLPPPTTLRYRFAPALHPPKFEGAEPSEELVAEFDAQVRAAMQAELDVFAAREVPVRERVKNFGRQVRTLLATG